MGDPAGIGPEIIVAALHRSPSWLSKCVIFGDVEPLERAARSLDVKLPNVTVRCPISRGGAEIVAGQPSVDSGAAAVAYLDAATTAVLEGECAAIVTAPLAKQWAQQAGFSFAGHTEYLAHRCNAHDVVMMFVGPRLKVALVTVHRPLRDVAQSLSVARIARVCELVDESMRRDFAIVQPRIAVVGLNPHAGENGTIGDEEQRIIAPGMLAATACHHLLGPWVPDVAFRLALDGAADALIAMYHDQALIPVKLIDFDDAVNVTLGLPIVRTSPDHGTAFDIAGTGRARATSMMAAIDLAFRMVETRRR
jgi:4-hydroxythreonine-4-phosphate dehydrogenase